MPIITSNIEEFTETRISVDANTYSLTLTNYSNIMLEVVKEEVSASITIPAYAIANISVSPNMHLIIRRQNIDPNALILTGMQIYYSQNSTKISDSIQPLSNLPAYIMHTDITAPINIEGTIPVTGTVSLEAGTTVNIASMPNVTLASGTVVNIGSMPSVTIAGTPTVNIGTGSISIANGNINIANTPDVNVNSAAPQPGQGYCAPVTMYVAAGDYTTQQVMFMAKNPTQSPDSLPSYEFNKSSRISGLMVAMPPSWSGVSTLISLFVDFYQVANAAPPIYPIYSQYVSFYYNANGDCYQPIFYQRIDTPFMANCVVIRATSDDNVLRPISFQVAIDAVPYTDRITLNGRQALGVAGCDVITHEAVYSTTGGHNDIIFRAPSTQYIHLTYAEDGYDMTGAVSTISVSLLDENQNFRGKIMRYDNPAVRVFKDYPLDIWLPPSWYLRADCLVTTVTVRRLLYMYYENWNIAGESMPVFH
jgi:hypothetical protein